MYNMDISLFGYKINLEILIFIGILYLIICVHTFCSCCNIEGMTTASDISGNITHKIQHLQPKIQHLQSKIQHAKHKQQIQSNLATQNASGTNGTTSTTTATTTSEGFTGANINYGLSSPYSLNDNSPVSTANWSLPDMTVTPGQPLSSGVQSVLNRKSQPIPLPEGEMLMFANTPFKPECCPNTYSNSSGCACMTGNQYNYLVLRGGNNVPYSKY